MDVLESKTQLHEPIKYLSLCEMLVLLQLPLYVE